MIEDCTALILAGGESQRMGRDKANMLFSGRTLLEEVASVLAPLFSKIIVSTREHRPGCSLPQVLDHAEHRGPLAGLLAGLEQTGTSWVFAIGCDMPFVSAPLIEYLSTLRDNHDAVVPVAFGHLQPMAAFYSRGCLNALHGMMQDGEAHSMREFLDRIPVLYVNEEKLREHDPMLRSFFDLDTPHDFEAALDLAKAER